MNEKYTLREKKKRGKCYYSATRRVSTTTIRNLQTKLQAFNIDVSYGAILSLRPFFVVNATEREMMMCMCLLCLNLCSVFNALMEHHKENDTPVSTSVSGFLMGSSECEKDKNGYSKLKCCIGKCHCKDSMPKKFNNFDESNIVSYYRFETVNTTYNSRKNGEEKKSKNCGRVNYFGTYHQLYEQMIAIRTEYLHHRYQVTNDKFVWDNVLNTVDEHGEIFHLDFSENITCSSAKFEPQSAHFAKKQISLHCSVMHNVESLKYIYHQSNELVHKSFFTIKVINNLLKMKDNNNNEIVRFKSDNCSAQYKCKFVFALLQDHAINLSKMIIYYYGVKGHGKGLVDAMSGFGVKTPLRNAIITKDKYFNSAKEVYDYFMQTNNDVNKMYFYLPEMKDDYNNRSELPIKGCTMQHMIIFEASGSIKVKENLCACKYCIVGDVLKCKKEKGKLIVNCHVESETLESDSDGMLKMVKIMMMMIMMIMVMMMMSTVSLKIH